MSSKFAEFLEKNKIDARRVMAASRKLEQLRPEDRSIKLAKRLPKRPAAALLPLLPVRKRRQRSPARVAR